MIRALVSCACVMNEILAPSFSLSERGLNRSPFWAKKQGKRKGKKKRKNQSRTTTKTKMKMNYKRNKSRIPSLYRRFPVVVVVLVSQVPVDFTERLAPRRRAMRIHFFSL